MAGIPFWPHGTTVTWDGTDIEGIESIELSGSTVEEVETTDNDSGGKEETVPGKEVGGSLTLNCRMYIGEAGQSALRSAKDSGDVKEVVITLPSTATDDSTVGTFTFDAWVRNIEESLPQVAAEAAMVTFEFKVTGGVGVAVA